MFVHSDSVIRIAHTKLMTSEMLVECQGNEVSHPLSKYAPPGAHVRQPIKARAVTLVNLTTHTSALPREQPGGAAHRRYLSGQPANNAGTGS